MTKLTIGRNEFILEELDGNDLNRLAQGLVADVECYSFHQLADSYDKAKQALNELMEYIIFDKK